MQPPVPICIFLSRREVEVFEPASNWHLVSISDGPEDQAVIDEARWQTVSYHHFVDAGFDEDVIDIYGPDFEKHYVDYLLRSKADILRHRLHEIAAQGGCITVNCHAGRSRSAAVARYLSSHLGYQLDKPTPDANMCVYRMLAMDERLMAAYQAATHEGQSADPPQGLLAALRKLFR